MNWQPGDHAIIVKASGEAQCYNGVECEILSGPETVYTSLGEYIHWAIRPVMIKPEHLDIERFWARAHNLKPLDDGHEPGSWDDCVWKPKAIRNEETKVKIRALRKLGEEIIEERRNGRDKD